MSKMVKFTHGGMVDFYYSRLANYFATQFLFPIKLKTNNLGVVG